MAVKFKAPRVVKWIRPDDGERHRMVCHDNDALQEARAKATVEGGKPHIAICPNGHNGTSKPKRQPRNRVCRRRSMLRR